MMESLLKLKASVGQSAMLTSIGAAAGAMMSIMALLTYLHIDVIPFAWADDVTTIKESIQALTDAVNDTNRSVLAMQRDELKRQRDEAADDLEKDPTSRVARKEVERLDTAIADVNAKIAIIDSRKTVIVGH